MMNKVKPEPARTVFTNYGGEYIHRKITRLGIQMHGLSFVREQVSHICYSPAFFKIIFLAKC